MSVCQLFCISEMLFITFTLQNDAILIIGNMILLIGIIFLSTLSHLKPSIISIQTPDIANCLYHLLLYPERLYPASYLWRIGNHFYSFRIFRIPPD